MTITFEQIAERVAAFNQPLVDLTPLGRATCLARRLAAALANLDPKDRQNILMQLVCSAAPGPEGIGFGLTIHLAPTPDPAA